MAFRWMDEESASEGWELQWEDRAEDRYTLACRLEPDGTLGETLSADTAEGRRLLAAESQLVRFAGEEAVLNTIQIDPSA